MSLSSTAEAIKHYKVTFNWKTGFESWSKVPTTKNYHMLAPNLGLEATGADEIRDNIDDVDKEIIDIISKRIQLVEKIGEFKKEQDLTTFQVDRWNEIFKSSLISASTKERVKKIHEFQLYK